ncbi:MAG: amidohydrolase family protein [Nevskiaceae bacterium]
MRTLAALMLVVVAAPAVAADLLIRGGRVHTLGPAGTLETGSVLIRDGRIAAVGAALEAPAGAQVIDASGKIVTPGIVAAYTQIGLREIDGVPQSVDDATVDDRFGATLDVTDALNPRSVAIAVNRIEGVTRAIAAPVAGKRDALLSGFGALVNLGSSSRFVTRERVALFATGGEEAAALMGGSRPAALAWLREVFEEVRNPKAWTGRPNREPLLSPLEAEALKPVLEGRVPLVVSAHRASDLRVLLKLAADYRLRLVVHGGGEAHLVAPELAARKVPVILDPTWNLPARFEALAAADDAAARLQRAGVLIAFMQDGDTFQNARNLRQLAGNAVARGLPWDAALAAITLNPARIFGAGAELGSLEAGKLADVVIWDGDPLELQSYPVQVLIDGSAVPAESRQTQLRDRYLRRK